eukprot:2852002-Pleurochrysis_carterae.AAC.1
MPSTFRYTLKLPCPRGAGDRGCCLLKAAAACCCNDAFRGAATMRGAAARLGSSSRSMPGAEDRARILPTLARLALDGESGSRNETSSGSCELTQEQMYISESGTS